MKAVVFPITSVKNARNGSQLEKLCTNNDWRQACDAAIIGQLFSQALASKKCADRR